MGLGTCASMLRIAKPEAGGIVCDSAYPDKFH